MRIHSWHQPRYWRALFSLIFLVASYSSPALAQTCKFWHEIKFADGQTGCLTDYPLAKWTAPGYQKSIAETIKSGNRGFVESAIIALPRNPKQCGEKIGFQHLAYASTASSNVIALGKVIESCQKAGSPLPAKNLEDCQCTIVLNGGFSPLTKSEFDVQSGLVTDSPGQTVASGSTVPVPTQQAGNESSKGGKAFNQTPTVQVLGGSPQDAERVKANLLAARQAMEEEDRKAALALAPKPSQDSARLQAAALAAAQVEAARQADRLKQVEFEERLRKDAAAAAQRQQAAVALSEQRAKEAKPVAAEPAVAAPQVSQVARVAQTSQAPQASQVVKLTARALVIGNGAYTHFGRLANARNDAQDIADKLRSFGIEVDLVLDADRDKLVKALNDYAERAVGKDVNLLFYAGHGVQIEGINYIIPTSMRTDGVSAGYVKLNGVALNAVMDYMPAKTRLIFLDACRDNPASRALVASRSSASVGLAAVSAATGTLIAYATKEGAVAADGLGKNSPYTTALLRHLDAPLDIGIILRRVRQTVLQMTSNGQEPWEYGSLVGDQLILSQMAR